MLAYGLMGVTAVVSSAAQFGVVDTLLGCAAGAALWYVLAWDMKRRGY
jgi:hypothetical protein